MKTIVLDVQKDLFESSVLEQSVPIHFLSYEESLVCKDASSIILGSRGIDDYYSVIRNLSQSFYKKGTALILVNPPVEIDLASLIDAPVSIIVKKRKASSICKCFKTEGFQFSKEYEIWSNGVIATSLSSGILGLDDSNECILLKYQPKNTAGAVFITTMKLLSYSGMTKESDREDLLKQLLVWKNTIKESISIQQGQQGQEEYRIEHSVLTAVAILAFAYNDTTPSKIASIISRFFTFDYDSDSIQKAIDELSLDLRAKDEKDLVSKLEDYIDQAGLYSYAREIKEILEEEEEVYEKC